MNTIKDYKEPLRKECNRVLECMSKEHPSSANYRTLVDVLTDLDQILTGIEYDERDRCKEYPTDENKCSQPVNITAAYVNEEAKAFPSSSTIPEPVGEPERTAVVEEQAEETLTKERVRAILKEASDSGVLIQPILSKFVPSGKKCSLSSIKAADYEALVKEVRNAG